MDEYHRILNRQSLEQLNSSKTPTCDTSVKPINFNDLQQEYDKYVRITQDRKKIANGIMESLPGWLQTEQFYHNVLILLEAESNRILHILRRHNIEIPPVGIEE